MNKQKYRQASQNPEQYQSVVIEFLLYIGPVKNSVQQINEKLVPMESDITQNAGDAKEAKKVAGQNLINISEVSTRFETFE